MVGIVGGSADAVAPQPNFTARNPRPRAARARSIVSCGESPKSIEA